MSHIAEKPTVEHLASPVSHGVAVVVAEGFVRGFERARVLHILCVSCLLKVLARCRDCLGRVQGTPCSPDTSKLPGMLR